MQISVVIPTYQRKETVKETVQALATQTFKGPFEVIVVVDGSTDGTADALRHLAYPFPLMVVEQANQGAAQARNMGARRAAGDIILFIDDDMMAHPGLLAEHARSHEQGWNAVLGHIPLHPESPFTLLSVGIEKWADARAKRLTQPDAQLTLHDLLTGQLSVTRPVFEAIGGFDTGFTAGGAFGNEDIDFGYRLLEQGYRVHFNPHAISWQKYVVTPERYLVQWHQTGQADVRFARKYPEEATRLFELNWFKYTAMYCPS